MTTPARTTDAATVVRDRHRAAVRRRAIRWAVVVLVVLLAAGAVWAVWFSDWFVVRSVAVTGTAQVSADTVQEAAQVPIGAPLVSLDVAAIRERVLTVPVVADATVARDLGGVVTIQVTERKAVYVMAQAGAYVLVDTTGVPYLTATSAKGLPVVSLRDTTSEAGKRLMADAAVIAQALPKAVTARMTTLSATTPDNFTIDLKGGATIVWGSAEQSELKAQVITGLLAVDASVYDVSSPSHPATR